MPEANKTITDVFCFSFGLSNKFETEFPQGLSAKVKPVMMRNLS